MSKSKSMAKRKKRVARHAQKKPVANKTRAAAKVKLIDRGPLKKQASHTAEAQVTETKTRSSKKSREALANVYTPEEIKSAISELSRNDMVVGYLKKNVSKRALDVINNLTLPKTDEGLAAELDMKINAVRRILNIMQGYGITNYYVAKNVNGWLSFAWYINLEKLAPFFEYISGIENKRAEVSEECNDYFICSKCYESNKLIFTFDAAFEEGFRCDGCGKSLAMMDKEEATKLMAGSTRTT